MEHTQRTQHCPLCLCGRGQCSRGFPGPSPGPSCPRPFDLLPNNCSSSRNSLGAGGAAVCGPCTSLFPGAESWQKTLILPTLPGLTLQTQPGSMRVSPVRTAQLPHVRRLVSIPFPAPPQGYRSRDNFGYSEQNTTTDRKILAVGGVGGRTPCWWLMKTTRPALAVESPPPCSSDTQEPSLRLLLLAPSFPTSLPHSLALCMAPLQVPSSLPCGFYLSQQPWEASCPGNGHKGRQIPSMTVSSF